MGNISASKIEAVIAGISKEHPRIYFTGDLLNQLRGKKDEPPFKKPYGEIKSKADELLATEMPRIVLPENLYIPDGEKWDVRYPQDTKHFDEHERMMTPLRILMQTIPFCAFLYKVEGYKKYYERAVEGMKELAGLDLVPTSYTNTHQFHGVINTLGVALDYLWDDIEVETRDFVVKGLVERAKEFNPLTVQATFPEDGVGRLHNHNLVYGPPDMMMAALGLFHHVPEAEGWLRDILRYLDSVFPSWGGDDGGWAQGFGYTHSHYFQKLCYFPLIASGVNVFEDITWGKNNGKHIMYFKPYNGRCPSFGDTSYNQVGSLDKGVMELYASVYDNPYYQWYADRVDERLSESEPIWDPKIDISFNLVFPEKIVAKEPTDIPQSIHMKDIDWVAMHSDLAHGDKNIMLNFKSNDFGSYGHSHADQNSFILEAFGEPLLIDSGYYPWYASPHDMAWTRLTVAHNAVLINKKGQGVFNKAAKGSIEKFVTGKDFDYVVGEATQAYNEQSVGHRRGLTPPEGSDAYDQGVEKIKRHILFARPNVFIIIDDIEVKKALPMQLMWHAEKAFEIVEGKQEAIIRNGKAGAKLSFLYPGKVEMEQTGKFPIAPELPKTRGYYKFPDQWHLTCNFNNTVAKQLLLTVIQVGKSNEIEQLPGIDVKSKENGLRISFENTEVHFDNSGINCKKNGVNLLSI